MVNAKEVIMMLSKRGRTGLLVSAVLVAVAVGAVAQGKKALDAQVLTVGTAAPPYSLPDQNGQVHTSASDKGKVVLMAFYPADFTGGCTLEAHSLTTANKDLAAMGVQVYGVSVQDSKSHAAFCTKEGIPYTLLADTEKTMARDYGVLIPTVGVANRVTIIVGKDGKIVYTDTNVNGHLTTCGSDWVTWLKEHPEVLNASSDTVSGLPSTPSAQSAGLASPHFAASGPATIGKPAPDFSLPDVLTGAQSSLTSLALGKRATVVIFTSTRCPISNAYNERMTAIANKYAPQGVAFVAINANHNEPLDEVKSHTQEHNYPFPVLKDAADTVADSYDARVTPETYVIGADGTLLYHGRIDNSDDPSQVHTHELADAIDSVLAGQPVAKAHTKAFGCSIKRAS
jgi:peroxiredoxin